MKLRMLLPALLAAAPLFSASPRIAHGSVQPLPSIAQGEAQAGPAWFGYAIRTNKSVSLCGHCSLSGDGNLNITHRDDDDLKPAGSGAVLFAHVSNHQIDRLRLFSEDCDVDAAGQTVQWVDNVPEGESIRFLRRVVEQGEHRAAQGALLALSLHSGATDTLIDIARNNPSSHTRGQALFWLSQQAGDKAAAALRDAVENDPESDVKSKAVFGISQLPDDQSIPLLIDLMKNNRSREVRKKAAFWLGQKHDPRALAAFEELLK